VSFGEQCVGAPGAAREISVSNNGDEPVQISAIAVVGANASDFTLSGAQPRTLATGETMEFSVRFTPSSTGDRSAAVRITSNAPSSPNDIPVSGGGVTRSLEVTPTQLAFGDVRTGTASDELVLQLASIGSAPVTITRVVITGDNPGDFSTSTPADRTLSPGEDGIVPVVFRPKSTGRRRAAITIESNACAGRTSIPVSGVGTSPRLQVRPSPVDFGAVAVGAIGPQIRVVVYNDGRAALRITDIEIEGAQSQDFRFDAFPDLPKVMGPGEEFDVGAQFAPSASGPRRAILRVVTDDSLAGTLSVELVGNREGAGSPEPTVSPSPTPAPTATKIAGGVQKKSGGGSGGIGDYVAVGIVTGGVGGIFAALFALRRRHAFD
jgi:hypothetical protein